MTIIIFLIKFIVALHVYRWQYTNDQNKRVSLFTECNFRFIDFVKSWRGVRDSEGLKKEAGVVMLFPVAFEKFKKWRPLTPFFLPGTKRNLFQAGQ